jgi:integrase
MSITQCKREIPTVAKAVSQFIAGRQNQHIREYISVLQGPQSGHVVGRRAAGVTLAHSALGPLRFDRVTGHEFVSWLHQRHPRDQVAASTFKKGRSALCQLLKFAIASGWADETVLAVVLMTDAKASPPRREWLRPEQADALTALVTERHFSSQQRFMWSCLLETGVRPDELVRLQPQALNRADGTLTVIGKGRGDGKSRTIPVSLEFQEEWSAYVREHALRPANWLFPLMQVRFVEGDHCERVISDASRHCSTKAVRSAIAKVRDLAEEAVASGHMTPSLLPPFQLSPKVLRRTFACTNLIAAALLGPGHGLDIRSLQMAMGHESLETTALYLSDVSDYLNRRRRTISVTDTVKRLTDLASDPEADADSLAA